jgi:hypothetical protein
MLKRIVLIIIILCSLRFYQLAIFPDAFIKGSEWLGIGLIFGFIVIYIVYGRNSPGKMHFALPIILILISVFISMLGAYLYHDQSFAKTAIAQRVIYYYFIYFLLHFMRIEGKFIIRTIVAFALVYISLYAIQYVLFPMQITKSTMFLDRGTIRIFLSGAGYLVIAYFIWLYLTFRSYNIIYVTLLLVSLGIFVLMGTRQVIASMLLLTILFIFQSRMVKSKALLFTLIGFAIVPVYFLFQDIIYAMFEVSVEQSRNIETNIRVRAAKYFLTEFYQDNLAYFTGHGAAGSTMYGLKMAEIAERYKFFQSDIGLIGEYTKYGALYVIAVFIILYRSLTVGLPEKLMFIKFNFLGILLTLVTGGGAFGGSGTNILINSMLLYMIDLYLQDNTEFDNFPGKKPVRERIGIQNVRKDKV